MISGLLRKKILAEQRAGTLELEVAELKSDVENLLEMNSKIIGTVAKKNCVVEKFKELANENKGIVAEKKKLEVEMRRMSTKNKLLQKRLEKIEFGGIVLLGVLAVILALIVFSK